VTDGLTDGRAMAYAICCRTLKMSLVGLGVEIVKSVCRRSAMAMPSSALLLTATGEDVAMSHNTGFSEVLRFTALH